MTAENQETRDLLRAAGPSTTRVPSGEQAQNDAPYSPLRLMRGRGAVANVAHRFEGAQRNDFDDGWFHDDERGERIDTHVTSEIAKSVLSRNQSPDIPFNVSINPYRGCEHGCIYCFARPTHSYLGLSPGLDFETRLFAKVNAVALLKAELARPKYVPEPIAVGVNTDAYQPIERNLRITRGILEVMRDFNQPISIITKSSLIERDLDILSPMAAKGLVRVALTITTLDHDLARKLEPRATSPTRRLRTMRTLADAGIPLSVSVSPIIPFINDSDMESILEQSAAMGATNAHFLMLRLPWELNEVFQKWLQAHYPDRANRVMNRIRDCRGGREYDSRFGVRMRGEGIWADLFRQRFKAACHRIGMNRDRRPLNASLFRVPADANDHSPQLSLFG